MLVHPISADTSKVPEPLGAAAMGTERELATPTGGHARPAADGLAAVAGRPPPPPAGVGQGRHAEPEHPLPGEQPGPGPVDSQAFAESYLAYRADLAAATREGSRRSLEAALRDVSDRMATVRATLAATPAGAQAVGDTLVEEAAPYQARLAEVAAITPHTAGTVVSPAALPSSRSGAGPTAAGVLGALFGLVDGFPSPVSEERRTAAFGGEVIWRRSSAHRYWAPFPAPDAPAPDSRGSRRRHWSR